MPTYNDPAEDAAEPQQAMRGLVHATPSIDDTAGRAASRQTSPELHRAGGIHRQIAAALKHAHEAETSIAYDEGRFPLQPEPPRSTPRCGLSL